MAIHEPGPIERRMLDHVEPDLGTSDMDDTVRSFLSTVGRMLDRLDAIESRLTTLESSQ